MSPNGATVSSFTAPDGTPIPQSFAALHCHIVFSTKQRRALIGDEFQPRLFQYVGGILRSHSSQLIAAGGMPDHVHLLASLSRTLSVADAIRAIKSNSSGWIHKELGLADFQWQSGYGAFAVSFSQLDEVQSYIANQKHHHRRISFQQEFLELLRRHEIAWDEQYVWD